MRKKIAGCAAAVLLCACFIGGSPALAVELQQTSGTNDKILSAADQAELLPGSMDQQSAEQQITKEQACALAVRLYASLTNCSYDVLMHRDTGQRSICPFTDTKNEDVREAWLLELTQEEDGMYQPKELVSQQQFMTLLYRAIGASGVGVELSVNEIAEALYSFTDGQYVPDWAAEAMAYFVRIGVTNGVGDNLLGVGNSVSMEQAAVLTYRAAAAVHTGRSVTSSKDISTISMHSGTSAVRWSGSGADYYLVYFYQQNDFSGKAAYIEQVSASGSGAEELTLPDEIADTPGIWYWSVDGFASGGKLLASSDSTTELAVTVQPDVTAQPDVTVQPEPSMDSDMTTMPQMQPESIISPTIPDGMTYAGESYRNKVARIFGEGSSYHLYSGAAEAETHQVTITVNVWDFDSNGNKVTRTRNLQVHEALASSVQQIFAEIYAGQEQFPIHTLGGYNWRGNGSTSEHCLGTAIDINWDENYMCTNSGKALTGTHWTPGVDPYSIPANSEVVQIFAKYGFGWGGTWNSKKDYMHFSYFGT